MNDNALILGCDPSLNSSGIAILDSKGKPVHFESINPAPLIGRSRLHYIYNSVLKILNSFKNVEVIAYEKQLRQERFNYNAKYILDLAENIGVLKLAIHNAELTGRSFKVYGFTAPEIKKYATGNSKADKPMMEEVLGIRVINNIKGSVPEFAVNDCVDAYHAARMAYALETNQINGDYVEV